MKKGLLIIGASGHGRVVADIAVKLNIWENIAFLDDNDALRESIGLKVIGSSKEALNYIKDWEIFIAVGNNEIRRRMQKELEAKGASIPVLIHPDTALGSMVEVGAGTVVMAGAVINSSTTIGKGCIINTGATVDHDNLFGDYVHISPGAHTAGNVKIGSNSWLGIGSVVSNNLNITRDCVIGAGSVVIKNIDKTGTYIGVPARRV